MASAVPLVTWAGVGCGGGGTGTGGSSTTTSTTSTTSSTTSSTTTSTTSTTTSSTTTTTAPTCPPTTGPLPPNMTCAAAETHALALNGVVNVNATTAGATANYPFCLNPPQTSPEASSDVVYAFTLASAGVFSLVITSATGSTLLPNIDVRTDCAKASLNCVSNGTNTGTFTQDLVAGTYYVIISGQGCTSGAFALSAKLSPLVCGNGIVDTGEDCDPGPSPPANNGCGAPGTANECKFIPAPAGQDQCPGQAIAVPTGTTILAASTGISTYGFKDDAIGSCQQAAGGRDRIFQLTPATSGTMTVSIGYEPDGVTSSCAASMTAAKCWSSMLYARKTCATASTEISGACALGVSGLNIVPAVISFPVTAGTPYWVFADGYDDQYYSDGPFNLIVKLQ